MSVVPNSEVRLLGRSEAVRNILADIDCAARSGAKVLITGETGVGKEVVARLIHHRSARAAGRLVTVNCAGLPDSLLESELFGHVRGSFTDAYRDKEGWLEQANGGTIFMDEIGEMSTQMQSLLLRFLENGEIQRVGSERRTTSVDVRVITATNRRLMERVASGDFREDLFYRLNVVHIEIPPLRERRQDIPELARLFAREEGAADLDDDFIAEMSQREFPGNVRELRNAVLSYIAIGSLPLARPSMLPPPPAASSAFAPRFDAPYLAQRDAIVESFTREYLTRLLEATKGNQSEAARIAGLDRTYLGRMLSKMGITRK